MKALRGHILLFSLIFLLCLKGTLFGESTGLDFKKPICAADLNGDGFISYTEYANCKNTPTCPDPRVPCDPVTKMCVVKENPICPEGSHLDPQLDVCIADPEIKCPSGYRWDASLGYCVKDPDCKKGTLDRKLDACTLKPSSECPEGYALSGDTCVMKFTCPDGGSFDSSLSLCVVDPELKCPEGFGLREVDGKKICVKAPDCPSGFTFSANADACVKSALEECPPGYSYNSETGRCERLPDCGDGWWSRRLKACIKVAGKKEVEKIYYVCSLDGKSYTDLSECRRECETTTYTQESYYSCSLNGQRYSTYWQCRRNCTSTYYTTETDYVCSLDGRSYSSYSECKSNCKSTTYVTQWACSVNGRWYSSRDACNAQCWGSYYLGSGCDSTHGMATYWVYSGRWAFWYNGPVGGTYVYGGCSSYSSSCNDGKCTYWPGAHLNDLRLGDGSVYARNYEICYSCSETKRGVCTEKSTPKTTYGSCTPHTARVPHTQYGDCTEHTKNVPHTEHGSCAEHRETETIDTCPVGYSYDSTLGECISHNPICPEGGSYDARSGVCYREITLKCPEGSTYDRTIEKCVMSVQCKKGHYSSSLKACEVDPGKSCTSFYTLREDLGKCVAEAECPDGGILDSRKLICTLSPQKNCPPGYTYMSAYDLCEKEPECKEGGSYDPKIDLCVAEPQINCPSETSYAVKEKKCTAPPQCEKGIYNPDTNQCEISEKCVDKWSCPIFGGSECRLISTKDSIFSRNQFRVHEGKKPFYDKDGDVNGEGCNGKVYIFNGYPMECLTAGIMTGFHNCCSGECDGKIENYINQSMKSYGTLIDGTMAYKAIMMGIYAYRAYKAYREAGKIWAEEEYRKVKNGAGGIAGNIKNELEVIFTKAKNNPITFVKDVLVNAGIKGYLLSTAASFATDLAFKAFFGGCSAEDDLTVCYKKHGLCHYVGSYCKLSWPLVGCVQRAKVYCCFSSKLARIVHEQGRPQLRTFGRNKLLMWGDPEDSPNCRGFTPQEFQMLDFSRIDLSEWYADINAKAKKEIMKSVQKSVERLKAR